MTTQLPAVVITRRLAPGVVDVLAESCDLRQYNNESPMARTALLDAAGPGMRIIENHAFGFHNIDVPACTARGVIATTPPDILTDATAGLGTATDRRPPGRRGRTLDPCRETLGVGPTFMLGRELRGTTRGIISLGRIRRAVAERAIGFGMTIVYHNRQSTIDLILRFRTC